ncbi:MAG: hypothetical protein AAB011_12230 [Candidatus Eisenbacteria bacterium]
MASAEAPDEVIRQVVAALDVAGVPYMLTGSFASSLHGAPRSTQDLDLVIAPDEQSLERLVNQFPPDRYYLSRVAAFDALHRRSLFNVIALETGWKVDFIIRKSREFSTVEFDRRVKIDLLGAPMFVATPEDVVISKLEWAKRSGSDRQIEDVVGIVKSQGVRLDAAYVERWIGDLELRPQWAEALARAR